MTKQPRSLPRFMNRGLIEASLSDGYAVPSIALPRFMNRGLIEALDPEVPSSEADALPRFMNRGLIEARVRPGLHQTATRTSPIHESGPH